MIFNQLEEEIVQRMGSAMFGPPGAECDRTGPVAKPRTLGVGWLLYAFVRAARPKMVLEIGTGGSTACVLWGLKHNGIGHIHTCDVFASGEGDDKHFADYEKEPDGTPMNHNKADVVRMIRKWEMQDICTIHHESSKDLLPKWNKSIDMLVVDGEHHLDFLQNDVQFMNFLKPGGYGIFHDFLACLGEVGVTLVDWVGKSDEWSMVVEPNLLSLAIVQRKFSFDGKHAIMCWHLSREFNPNAIRTPLQGTDPRAGGMIVPWNGQYFDVKNFHKEEAKARRMAEDIVEYERRTGKLVQSMEGWNG